MEELLQIVLQWSSRQQQLVLQVVGTQNSEELEGQDKGHGLHIS